MLARARRFTILARDQFTCRYCGRKAPDVVLEVDHIHPRSRGGRDTQANLVTSCFDCNRGKTNRVLLPIPTAPPVPSPPPLQTKPKPLPTAPKFLDVLWHCGDWCPYCLPENESIRPVHITSVAGGFDMRYRGRCGHEWGTWWSTAAALAHAKGHLDEGIAFWPPHPPTASPFTRISGR